MPRPTKDEVIRAEESIRTSVMKIENFVIHLADQGLHEEARAIEIALKKLKKSLTRIRVNEEGKVVTVQ